MRAGATGWQRDLQKLTDGFSKCDGVNIGSATTQQVCEEYATRRRQFKASRLRWRVSNRQSPKRSLGWVPFKSRAVRYKAGQVKFAGQTAGGRSLEPEIDADGVDARGLRCLGHHLDVQVPTAASVFRERARPQLELRQAVAVPQADRLPRRWPRCAPQARC